MSTMQKQFICQSVKCSVKLRRVVLNDVIRLGHGWVPLDDRQHSDYTTGFIIYLPMTITWSLIFRSFLVRFIAQYPLLTIVLSFF